MERSYRGDGSFKGNTIGFLAKHDGKYLTTELGEKQLNTLQKRREVERTEPLPICVKIEEKIKKSLPQAAALMTEDVIKLEMFPSPAEEERNKISEATLHFLSEIVKARNLRNKIAEKKKLIVMISLDLSDVDLDAKYIDNALCFAFIKTQSTQTSSSRT